MQTLNIVDIIENNPISCINNTSNNLFIDKINQNFTNDEQHLFIASFYGYLNYNKNDFVIDLDKIYKWIGFSRKDPAKRLLEKCFTRDKDYRIENKKVAPLLGGAPPEMVGGYNKEKILLTITTFKKLCLKADTKKADEIHNYYIKLEEILQEVLMEESKELRQQLENKNVEYKKQLEVKDLEKKRDVENTLKNSFNKRCLVYLIKIEINDEIIYKFGYTDNIISRLRSHKNQISEDIELIYCIESKDNKLLERLLIDYLEQYKFRIKRIIKDKQQTELLKVTDIEIIKNKLIELNRDIENEQLLIIKLKNKIIELENENIELKKLLLKDDNQIIKELENKIHILEEKILHNKLDEPAPFIENKEIVEDRIYKRSKVDKIDPTTLQILETYECINAIIIKNPEFSYNQLYRSIKKNNVYKDFRWNYTGEKIMPTNKILMDCNKIEKVIQLDKHKNFVKIYLTKSELCKFLHIGLVKLNKIIEEEKILNDFYYVNESSYEGVIPDINYEIHNSKKIREINIDNNEITIYKTMKELYEKRGISRSTLRDCIKNNRICDKYRWEYVNENQNKNNSKKVKETNINNNTYIIYESMKLVYTKLNITLEKLRCIIKNQEIINNCKYELC